MDSINNSHTDTHTQFLVDSINNSLSHIHTHTRILYIYIYIYIERSMIDLILVEEVMRKRLIDVTVRRGVAGGIGDHFLVESKVKRCA